MVKRLNRLSKPVDWFNLKNTQPISRLFGFDRGTPIDRYYIEEFLQRHQHLISGHILEISEKKYSIKYGRDIQRLDVLDPSQSNSNVTILGDLTNFDTLPREKFDCFICTQTLNIIYDFKKAVQGSYFLLKPNGVMLATVPGLSQISRYDRDRWGDYWRFTDLSILKIFSEVFGEGHVEVQTYGNVLSALAFIEGIAVEELTKEELDYQDKDYQVSICVKARK